ncbi:increased DNA methylation 3-like [Camellia sinensis]|uniref:increased DNA methylation 3-like n=1 Tax=Camellia sinensis TaxID=4442 RepID=UPI00103667D6|nr:increased DNA methylation 3-like [Camellia sinensis]
MEGKDSHANGNSSAKFQDEMEKGSNLDGPFMMPLLLVPNASQSNSKASVILTGTATRGGTVLAVGVVDIGVSKSAYFFQVALPGIRKDPGQFSCEIERDGKDHVRGVTSTGGKTVLRHSRIYEMKFQQQCPPGPFTLSFSLLGPVDPRLFSPHFRSDGILEAVVLKYE